MSAWLIWLIIGIVLLIAEMTTFTFYLLWLGLGALAAALVAALVPDMWLLHIIVAAVVALGLTYFTKPLTRRLHGKKGFKDAVDQLVWKQGEVTETIEPGGLGIVRIGTETWSATADERIERGETIIVESRGTAVVHVIRAATAPGQTI